MQKLLPGKRIAATALIPVADQTCIIISIAHSGETGTELTPSTPDTPKRQKDRRDQNLAKVAYLGTKDFTAALFAERKMLFF